jgi:hypothetical protein
MRGSYVRDQPSKQRDRRQKVSHQTRSSRTIQAVFIDLWNALCNRSRSYSRKFIGWRVWPRNYRVGPNRGQIDLLGLVDK